MVSIPPNLAHRAFTGECPTDKRLCRCKYAIDIQSLTGYYYVELTLTIKFKEYEDDKSKN